MVCIQQEGINYDETFAPFVGLEVVRIFIAYATYKKFNVYQVDVNISFLNRLLEETTYAEHARGFINDKFPNYFYILDNSVCGLKQALHACYATLTNFLKKYKLKQGFVDPTLFRKNVRDHLMLDQIYIDHIIFGSIDPSFLNEFLNLIRSTFEMGMTGKINFFLGLNIQQIKEGIFTNEKSYTKNLIEIWVGKYSYEKVPMHFGITLSSSLDKPAASIKNYRSIIGLILI